MNPEEAAPEPGDAAWRFAGHWFVILGLTSILAMPIQWSQDLGSVDLSFILMFWLAGSLFGRSVWARRIALGLCVGLLGLGTVLVIVSFLDRAGTVTIFAVRVRNPAPDLAAAFLGAAALVALPPAVALLGPDARRLAGVPRAVRPHDTFVLLYVAAMTVFLSAAASLPKAVRRESLVLTGGPTVSGPGGMAWFVDLEARDGGQAPQARLEKLVVAIGSGTRSSSLQAGDGIFKVNGHAFRVAPERSWVILPPKRGMGANLVLIDDLGTPRGLPRRVTAADVPALLAAAAGFKDAEDLERRLLSALPSE